MQLALRIVGLALLGFAATRYVALWISLLTARERRPKLRGWFIITILLGGTIGASMLFWSMICWWMVPLIYCGIAVLVVIPALLFRAR